MKYASEDLRTEHEGILFGLQILEAINGRLQSDQLIETDDLNAMVDFFKLFADQCHHGKEEGLYFPSLENAGIKNQGGPIGQMLLEHIEGRKYIAQMDAALNNVFLPEDFVEASARYVELLRAHIEKENTVLFVMGDKLLPADEQTRLLSEFESFEEDVMGSSTHQRLHEMLDRFEQKFLS